MSTGQTLLAIGALVLLMNISMAIHRSQIHSISDSLDHQLDIEAINYGQSLMEAVFYSVNEYSELDALYENLSDVTDPSSRLEYETIFGDSLYATIDLHVEEQLINNVTGRQITVRVFGKSDDADYLLKVEYKGTVNSIW